MPDTTPVPTMEDFAALQAQVTALQAQVAALAAIPAPTITEAVDLTPILTEIASIKVRLSGGGH